MSISGKLLNPRLSQANVSASVKCSRVSICRAGRFLWVPKRNKLYLGYLSGKRTWQYDTRQENFYWDEPARRTEAFIWLRRKAKGNLSGLNVLSVDRETIAQVLVWRRGRRNLSLINFAKRNVNILSIKYDVSKPAPPCGETRVGKPFCSLSKNGNPKKLGQ
jgi:hypothetical protein